MAWTGTYSERIVKKLDDLAGAKYQPNYDDKIKGTAQQIADYGPYQSNYSKQISTLTNQIGDYGPYNSRYQPQLDKITDRMNNYGDYASRWQPQIDSLMAQLGDWNYDAENDKSYQVYKDLYTRNGQRAMQDTLGQVSARTGGLASSYATSAAQQSYNNYMDQLSAMIPQLEQAAYNRANNSLSMYNNADATDYDRWVDAYNRLYNQGNYLRGLDNDEYGRYRDALQDLYNQQSMYQNLDATDYGRWADALNNLYQRNGMYLNMDQNELARYQAAQSDAYEQLKAMQDYNDYEYQMYLADLAAAQAAAGGGGGYGGGYGGGGSGSSGSDSSSSSYTGPVKYGYSQNLTGDEWEATKAITSAMYPKYYDLGSDYKPSAAVTKAAQQDLVNAGYTEGQAKKIVTNAKRNYRQN